jgi:predicted  nucleic acid-binding Zn-ribbon protein
LIEDLLQPDVRQRVHFFKTELHTKLAEDSALSARDIVKLDNFKQSAIAAGIRESVLQDHALEAYMRVKNWTKVSGVGVGRQLACAACHCNTH